MSLTLYAVEKKRADIHDKSYRVGRRSRYLLVIAPVGTTRNPESYKEYICHTHQVERVDPARPYPSCLPNCAPHEPAGITCARVTSRSPLTYPANLSTYLVRE